MSLIASVTATSVLALGQAPSMAMDLVYVTMADSLSLAMGNAVANQQRGQVLTDAAVAQVLVMILAKGAKGK